MRKSITTLDQLILKTKINHPLGAVLSLLVTFALTQSAAAQPGPRIAAPAVDTKEVPMTVTGDLTVLAADDFVNHRSETFYSLQDATQGRTFHLRFDHTPPNDLQTGDRVTVRGMGK